MCSMKIAFAVLSVSAVVIAAPGGFGGQQGGRGGFGGQQGGRGGFGGPGGRGGHGGPPVPPFLQNVTEEGRQAFFQIVSNQNLTVAQIESQSAEWASTYGVSDQYTAFQANVTAQLEQVKQNVTAVISNLSTVESQLGTILSNKDQTLKAQREAIEALRQQYPQEVGALLLIAKSSQPRPQGPAGFGGPGGFGRESREQGQFGGFNSNNGNGRNNQF